MRRSFLIILVPILLLSAARASGQTFNVNLSVNFSEKTISFEEAILQISLTTYLSGISLHSETVFSLLNLRLLEQVFTLSGLIHGYAISSEIRVDSTNPIRERATLVASLWGLELRVETALSILFREHKGEALRFFVTPAQQGLAAQFVSSSSAHHTKATISAPQRTIEMADLAPLLIHTDYVDFGEVLVGKTESRNILLDCIYNDVCWIQAVIHLPNPPFYASIPVGRKIQKGQQMWITVNFRPDHEGEFQDELAFQYCFETIAPPLSHAATQPDCDDYYILLKGRGKRLYPPVAVCSFSPSNPKVNAPIQFSSADSYDPDGWLTGYHWDFGDGDSSTLANPVHSYSRPDLYNVTLTVWDNDGLSDETLCLVKVGPAMDLTNLVVATGAGFAAGLLSQNMLSQPPSSPPLAPGFAPAILPAGIAAIAGLYFFPVDQLIIKLPKGVSREEAENIIKQIIPQSEIIGFFSPLNAYLVRFRGIREIELLEEQIRQLDEIQDMLKARLPEGSWVLKNYLGRLEGEVDTWDLTKLPSDLRWAYESIRAPETWEILRSMRIKPKPVRVAIIDTGIQGDHMEFKDIDKQGYSYVKKDEKNLEDWQEDKHGHGTWVSGIIGAENGQGTMNGLISPLTEGYELQIYKVGITPSEISPLNKDISAPLFAVWDAVRKGISEAATRGAVIINMSIGWDEHNTPPEDLATIYESFERIMKEYPKVLFVTSAGNGDVTARGWDQGSGLKLGLADKRHAPGGVVASNNITVAAASHTKAGDIVSWVLTRWTNYGPAVDIAAPGENVYTTNNDGSYILVKGTSFSAALVSGAAALLLSIEPNLSPQDVKEILKKTARGSVWGDGWSIGLLDTRAAVEESIKIKERKSYRRLLTSVLVGVGVAIVVASIMTSR